jgi:tetratricopeptide (TPR) repeat protein
VSAALLAAALAALGQAPAAPPAAPDLAAVRRLVERGELEAAERRLRDLVARGGGPSARALLGSVLRRSGRFEDAERELRRALGAGPDLAEARHELARALLGAGKEAEALDEVRRAAAAGPLPRDLGLRLAAAELAEGRAASAERLLADAAERHGSVQALLQLGRLRSQRGDAEAALAALRRARELAPNSEDVLAAFAQLHLALRRPVPAILALDDVARMNPGVASHRYLLGVALLQAGDLARAADELQQAERLEPERPLTLVALGLAWNGQKRFAEARDVLQRALAREPESVEALAALAEAEEGLGELAAAEAHARRALAEAGSQATAHLVLGMVFMKQERWAEAREALERSVAVDPDSAKALYQLSLACTRLGDAAAAAEHLTRYQKARRELEQRALELERAGTSRGGMRR